jgi:hypothetical protein
MADAGVVEAIVMLLRHSSMEGRCHAAIALARMAANIEVRKRIWKADAVPPLVAALSELEPKGMEGAVICLEKLVTLQGAAEQTMHEAVRFVPLLVN